MATWRSDGIKFTQCVSGQKISIFAPVRKTMGWVKKWLTPFRIIVLTSSIIVQSLEIKLRAPAVGAKRLCFLIVTLDLPAHGGHSLYKYCATGLWVNFDAVFEVFFRREPPFRGTTQFLFSSLDGATIFAKLRSKIAKSQKIGTKVCAHHFVYSWEFSKKNSTAALRFSQERRCAPI